MYDVLDVSRYAINYSNEKDYGISNLKLQKILYLIQAYFLINRSEPCFPENIEAWDFGPVVPKSYHEYKQYGGGDIPYINSYIDINYENFWESQRVNYDNDIICEDDKKFINEVIDSFKNYTATDLVTLTHKQKPWQDAYEVGKNSEITREAIRGYFSEQ